MHSRYETVDARLTRFDDTKDYLQIAAQPLSLAHLFYPKPFLVPAVFRLLDSNVDTIVGFQREFAFWAWACLGLALFCCLRSTSAKWLGMGIALLFLFSTYRIGFMEIILSESLNDSLMALAVAFAVLFVTAVTEWHWQSRRLWTLAAGASFIGGAWLLCRDTNAFAVLGFTFAALVAFGLPRYRSPYVFPALAAVAAGASLFVLWSSQETPRLPTGLAVERGWQPALTGRGKVSMLNNFFNRVLPDPEAKAFFASEGLHVQAFDRLQPRGTPYIWSQQVATDPAFREQADWLGNKGGWVYAQWLLAHPVDRADDVITAGWTLLAPDLHVYMPFSKIGRGQRMTELPLFIAFLLVTAAPAFLNNRRSPLQRLSMCLILSGFVAATGAYYGDGIELARHAYGATQMAILAMCLGLVFWCDSKADVPPAP